VGDWIRAGAVAVGLGAALIDPKAVAEEHYSEISSRAARALDNLRDARERR
jgi:2-keto-3-deoxy-6-phosphogluconate aldolase